MDNQNDIFCEIVKDKLANYTLPVDDDSWDKITERLNRASRKKTLRLWIAAIAVPASIASLFLILPTNKKMYHNETANQLSNQEQTIVQNVYKEGIDQPTLRQHAENPTVSRRFGTNEPTAENNLTTEVIPMKEPADENPAVPAEEEHKSEAKHPVSPDFYLDSETEKPMPALKHKNRQSLRFSFSAGESLLADNASHSARTPFRSPGVNINSGIAYYSTSIQNIDNSRTQDILSFEDYPNVTLYPPLSFGITVKKELNSRFAVESGIVYSFLVSTFSKEAPLKSNAYLHLHYIGIPLNLHTRIFGNRFSPWEVYLYAGGTVEKGISSHFVQNTFYGNNDNSLTTVNSNEKIKGLQWSVGISPGIDYQIHRNYSLYLEPKISYYFDNNQPISARTEHPVVVGINAGIRYTW